MSTLANYNCFNSDITSLEKAVKERCLYIKENGEFIPPPVPENGVFEKLTVLYDKMRKSVRPVSPLTKEQFLGAYDGRKLTIYTNAFESLSRTSVTRKDSEIKAFMKVEKLNFSLPKEHVPRLISPRDPRYHVTLGPYIKRIEKKMIQVINQHTGPIVSVMKGLNASQRGNFILQKWRKYVKPVCLPVDCKRFDQHTSKQALEYEHKFYKLFYKGNDLKILSKLLRWQTRNKGKCYTQDGMLKYVVNYMRASGDMNTGIGNIIIVMSILLQFREELDIDFEITDDGDDFNIICESSSIKVIRSKLYDYAYQFGYRMQIEEPVYELEHIEFCQARPIMIDTNECRMVRDIRTSMSKDATSILPLNNSRLAAKWARSVGLCGLSLTYGVPVIQNYYFCMTKGSTESLPVGQTYKLGMHMLAEGMGDHDKQAPTSVCRLSFWKAFGIEPDKQEILERHFDGYSLNHQLVPQNIQILVPDAMKLLS